VKNPRAFVSRKHAYLPTKVCRGASVGANATIVCGVTLGRYCFVGAGAVVTRDVAPYALVVGAPAKAIGYVCRCGERLHGTGLTSCSDCGVRYQIDAEGCEPQSA
jgi:UDP-2-acetamido-3-amino-2,3-dideoxy-glucuronate N-acetyltransferase